MPHSYLVKSSLFTSSNLLSIFYRLFLAMFCYGTRRLDTSAPTQPNPQLRITHSFLSNLIGFRMLKSNLSRRRGTALNSSNPPSIFRRLQQKNALQVLNRGLQNSPNDGMNQVRRPCLFKALTVWPCRHFASESTIRIWVNATSQTPLQLIHHSIVRSKLSVVSILFGDLLTLRATTRKVLREMQGTSSCGTFPPLWTWTQDTAEKNIWKNMQ